MPKNDMQAWFMRLTGWAFLVGLIYGFWRWCAGYLIPFLIAAVLALALEPVVRELARHGISRTYASLVAVLGVFVTGLGLVASVFTLLLTELVELSRDLPRYWVQGQADVDKYIKRWTDLRNEMGLRPGVLNNELHALYRGLTTIIHRVLTGLLQVPDVALMVGITALATFFMLRDRHRLAKAWRRLLPPSLETRLSPAIEATVRGLFGFLRAQLALVALSTTATTLGLMLIRAPYAVLIGLLAGLLDLVPFLGPTAVIVPWSGLALLTGHPGLAVRLLLVLLGVVTLRQTVEPRLVGGITGLHPLVVLFSLYVGVKMFGAAGFVVGPVTAIGLKAMSQSRHATTPTRPTH